MSDTCFYCSKPAVRFCDFAIGGAIGGYERVGSIKSATFRPLIDIDQMPFTCDMPMCEDHAKQVGAVHVCGKQSSHDTIDYCPEHVGKHEDVYPCTEDEAATLRRGIRADARRALILSANQQEKGGK